MKNCEGYNSGVQQGLVNPPLEGHQKPVQAAQGLEGSSGPCPLNGAAEAAVRSIEDLQQEWWDDHLPKRCYTQPSPNDCGDLQSRHWAHIQKSAKARGLAFAIDIEYGWKLFLRQRGRCALSGVPLIMRRTATVDRTASLDRIDSAAGYVEGNVQWVHKTVNIAKMASTQEQFFDMVENIFYHSVRPNRPIRDIPISSLEEDEE